MVSLLQDHLNILLFFYKRISLQRKKKEDFFLVIRIFLKIHQASHVYNTHMYFFELFDCKYLILLPCVAGEGVGVSVSSFRKDAEVFEVEYCAFSHLQRHISFKPSQAYVAENFQLLTKSGQTGISFFLHLKMTDGF